MMSKVKLEKVQIVAWNGVLRVTFFFYSLLRQVIQYNYTLHNSDKSLDNNGYEQVWAGLFEFLNLNRCRLHSHGHKPENGNLAVISDFWRTLSQLQQEQSQALEKAYCQLNQAVHTVKVQYSQKHMQEPQTHVPNYQLVF